MKSNLLKITACAVAIIFASCGNKKAETNEPEANNDTPEVVVAPDAGHTNLGIGPISEEPVLGDVDAAMVAEGEIKFAVCSACHKFGEKSIGPDLQGVTGRRTSAWIMNMMLNPAEMLANDPDAKALLAEYNNVPMIDNQLTKKDARALLEYIRSK